MHGTQNAKPVCFRVFAERFGEQNTAFTYSIVLHKINVNINCDRCFIYFMVNPFTGTAIQTIKQLSLLV